MLAKKIVCIIPARLQASRYPKKLLTTLHNRPLLEWVWNAAKKVTLFNDVIFAVDDQELADVIDTFGGKWIMTSKSCQVGTDRLVEIMHKGSVSADIWVNWQGDEPFVTQDMIEQLLQSYQTSDADIWTLKKQIVNPQELISNKFAKVVCDSQGYALYFSRSMIPCLRDEQDLEIIVQKKMHYKHVGLYAFTTQALKKIGSNNYCALEDTEKLEMLRWLYYGLRIKVHQTDREVIGIDTPEDLVRAHEYAKMYELRNSAHVSHEATSNNSI